MLSAFKRLSYVLLQPWIIHRLRVLTGRDERSVAEWVDLVISFKVGTFHISPLQKRSEIIELGSRVHDLRPTRVLEIGTAKGGTLYLWCRLASRDAVVVSIDLPGGSFGGGYPAWKERLYCSFAGLEQTVHLVRGDSHSEATVARVEEVLHGEGVDFLFLDGDHSAAGVRHDLELYGPFVRPGGLIAFHDIVPGEESRVGGVPALWRSIQEQAETKTAEVVEDWTQGGYGIGILQV